MSTFASCSRESSSPANGNTNGYETLWSGGEKILSFKFLEEIYNIVDSTDEKDRALVLGFSALIRAHCWNWTHFVEGSCYGGTGKSSRATALKATDPNGPAGGTIERCAVIHAHLKMLLTYTMEHYKEYVAFPRPSRKLQFYEYIR